MEQYVTITMFNKAMEEISATLRHIMDNMATKDDIADLRLEMATKQDLRELRDEMKDDMQHLEEKFLYRYENHFERTEDNILQLKTKLNMR